MSVTSCDIFEVGHDTTPRGSDYSPVHPRGPGTDPVLPTLCTRPTFSRVGIENPQVVCPQKTSPSRTYVSGLSVTDPQRPKIFIVFPAQDSTTVHSDSPVPPVSGTPKTPGSIPQTYSKTSVTPQGSPFVWEGQTACELKVLSLDVRRYERDGGRAGGLCRR